LEYARFSKPVHYSTPGFENWYFELLQVLKPVLYSTPGFKNLIKTPLRCEG